MKKQAEFDIVQNNLLGSLALWTFAKEFYERKQKKDGPPLPFALPILPLVFNQRAVQSIATKQFEGGLFRAVAEDRAIPVGLQDRMEAMADQTFQSLNRAFSAGLLRYDSATFQLIPVRTSSPHQIIDDELKAIMATSKRLGIWFADLSLEQIFILLDVRF